MRKVDDYERIRKAYHIEGLSIREISRRYGHGRRLIPKALERPIPDKYQLEQPRKLNVLGSYRQRILDLLKESEKLPRKQRYTSHRVYEILEKEGYTGCEESPLLLSKEALPKDAQVVGLQDYYEKMITLAKRT